MDRAVGSVVGDGTISALSYGWRLVGLAETLLVASLVTALYPALGAAATNRDELRRLVARGLAATAVVLVPVTVVVLLIARPVVVLAYQRGGFTAADASLTAAAVFWYGPALLALGWREVVLRASFAVGDSRGPVVVALFAMAVNVIGDLTLGLAWGVPGLAASTSLSLVIAAAANTWLLRRRHDLVAVRPLAMAGRVLVAAGCAAVAAGVTVRFADVGPLLVTTIVAVVVSAVFAGALFVLRAPETWVLRDAVRLLGQRG